MIAIQLTSPAHRHIQGGWDLATTPFLEGKPLALMGNLTWPQGTPVDLDGFPFKTLMLKAFERQVNDDLDTGWVEVMDTNVTTVTLVDPTTAEFQHAVTPNDGNASYKLLLQVLDAASNVLSTSVPLVLESAPSS